MRLLYLRAASIILRPSQTSCEAGFSTYTCLPAWQAHMAPSACQWLGIAMETASISLSSNTLRISHSVSGFSPVFSTTIFALESNHCSSASQSVFNRILRLLFSEHQFLIWVCPCPWIPITAKLSLSFAPGMALYDLALRPIAPMVTPAPAKADFLIN